MAVTFVAMLTITKHRKHLQLLFALIFPCTHSGMVIIAKGVRRQVSKVPGTGWWKRRGRVSNY